MTLAAPTTQAGDFASPGALSTLSPASFGIVMATGIVAIAAQRFGLGRLPQALFALNLGAYALLWLLTIARALRHPRQFRTDLLDHQRAPGFFTSIAASGVLGAQCMLQGDSVRFAGALWLLTLALWAWLTYAIFLGLTVKSEKPTLDKGINGGWLLAVVATQSIVVLGALLAPQVESALQRPLHFFLLAMWCWGGMLYIWMMALIFYRYAFFRLAPHELTPPYWINMGAMAISTLAGSLLVAAAPQDSLLHSLAPFIKGMTIMFWATGTWWIPLLLLLGVWRYVLQRFPLRYDPMYWSVVFPLGMYATATDEMAQALNLGFLHPLPLVFAVLALAAWCVVFVAMLLALWRRLRNAPAARQHVPDAVPMETQPIRGEAEYKAALAELSALIDMAPEPGTPQAARLDALSSRIEAYERARLPLEVPGRGETNAVSGEKQKRATPRRA